jgi:hypothetical protein
MAASAAALSWPEPRRHSTRDALSASRPDDTIRQFL